MTHRGNMLRSARKIRPANCLTEFVSAFSIGFGFYNPVILAAAYANDSIHMGLTSVLRLRQAAAARFQSAEAGERLRHKEAAARRHISH
jgi:hypothetical protein